MSFWKKKTESDAPIDSIQTMPSDESAPSQEGEAYELENKPELDNLSEISADEGQAELNGGSDSVDSVNEPVHHSHAEDTAEDDQSMDQEALALEYEFQSIKAEVHQQVIGRMDLNALGGLDESELRIEVHRACEQILDERSDLLPLCKILIDDDNRHWKKHCNH